MKKNQKLLSLLLALLLVLPACSNNTPDGKNDNSQKDQNTPPQTNNDPDSTGDESDSTDQEETRIKPNIPESGDFGGQEIRFLHWEVDGWRDTVRQSRDIFAEGITAEPINDAVYNRNAKIEEAYKVKITLDIQSTGQIASTVSTAINGGDQTYSVIYPRLLDASSLFQKSYFHNLHNVPNIDLTKPWWDQNSINSLDCMGYLPCVATSINVNDKDATAALAFNKTIAEANHLENIYDIVREGKWTYDKLSELADIVDNDVNGDGKMDPDDDLWGLLGGKDVMTAFFHGSGSLLATHDEEGAFALTFGTERDINAAVAVVNLMNTTWFMNHHKLDVDDTHYRELFETGHGLFFWMRLDEVTNMRNGEADFGIIPTPKYEAEQDKYYSTVSQHTTGLMSIPITKTGKDLENIGVVLEAMAAESHYTLIPEYIESSLKTKHSRDAESADMLDIIINNRVFDPMVIYNFGGFSDAFFDLGHQNKTDIASFLKSKKKPVEKAIQKAVKAIVESSEK